MLIKKWENLPAEMQKEEIRPYYDILRKKNFSLFWKRVFDVSASALLLVLLSPLFLILALAVKIDSKGPVFYRQERVTQYGKRFKIHKFRSMTQGADQAGARVTVANDSRVTKVGRFIRKCRLDEIAQLIDVFTGKMTFVGTRPEVPEFVAAYTPEMTATLLLPAGVTGEASICFKDEAELLEHAENAGEEYVKKILPVKMRYNLEALRKFGLWREAGTLVKTVFAVLKKGGEKADVSAEETEIEQQKGRGEDMPEE